MTTDSLGQNKDGIIRAVREGKELAQQSSAAEFIAEARESREQKDLSKCKECFEKFTRCPAPTIHFSS
jgi:hypothetical protein